MKRDLIFFAVGIAVGFGLSLGLAFAQGLPYSDGKDCVLTSNPPIQGRIGDDGICRGLPLTSSGVVTYSTVLHCLSDRRLVMVSAGVFKCALPDLTEPQR